MSNSKHHTPCDLFCRAQKQPGPDDGDPVHVKDELDFHDPSWIIEHHRHNLITKILKPGGSYCRVMLEQTAESRSESCYNPGANSLQSPMAFNSRRLEEGQIGGQNPRREESYRINISEMQRLRLRQLQDKLVRHAIDLRYDALEPRGWANDLRQYVQGLQDYDYMGSHIFQSQDPFIVTGERFLERCMLHAAMRDKENEADPLRWAESTKKWETKEIFPVPIGGTRDENFRQSWTKRFQRRLVVAAIGGIFLIAPMWLIVLHRTLYTALVSTTVFVIIFGLMLALFLDGMKDVLSGTAAYSAVLVVFVGLTVPNNTP